MPPAPPAWLMQAAPNSQQTLDLIISPSEISLPSAG
ncbi:lysis system o-spanin lipoprotein Rz1, partial [Pseudomonas syringae]